MLMPLNTIVNGLRKKTEYISIDAMVVFIRPFFGYFHPAKNDQFRPALTDSIFAACPNGTVKKGISSAPVSTGRILSMHCLQCSELKLRRNEMLPHQLFIAAVLPAFILTQI